MSGPASMCYALALTLSVLLGFTARSHASIATFSAELTVTVTLTSDDPKLVPIDAGVPGFFLEPGMPSIIEVGTGDVTLCDVRGTIISFDQKGPILQALSGPIAGRAGTLDLLEPREGLAYCSVHWVSGGLTLFNPREVGGIEVELTVLVSGRYTVTAADPGDSAIVLYQVALVEIDPDIKETFKDLESRDARSFAAPPNVENGIISDAFRFNLVVNAEDIVTIGIRSFLEGQAVTVGHSTAIPEPSSLILSGIGCLVLTGYARWQRRRRVA